jgi:AraC-like DNA-binding protein
MGTTLAEALVATGPDPEHAQALMLCGQFVGKWEFDWAAYDEEGKQLVTERGEWIFGWVLEGRAVQDVWIIPERGRRESDGEYGTTIRFYDPQQDAWLVSWSGPIGGSRDSGDVEESVLDLAVAVLACSSPERLAWGRPATAAARRRVVSAAREALASNPRAGVIELARRVAVSPHHLSRVFKAETGLTISRYRNRLRVRLALERLSEGEPCLARLAADLAFADQAHLARVVRQELGATPSSFRGRLAS